MAEIDFKRRGTPLWLVLLVLLVVGGGAAYFLLDRRPDTPAATAVADSAATTGAPATGAAPAAAAPAGPSGPTAEFVRFADTQRLPTTDGAAQRTYLAETMRLMSGVLRDKAPAKGVQITMLQAIADTLAMPDTKTERVADLVQLGFFAYAYALNDSKVDDGKLTTAAGQLQPNVAIGRQAPLVNDFLRLSRDLLTGATSKGADTVKAPRTSAPPPKAKSGPATT
ncbi:MAG: hypothetical protein ACXW61_06440 [Gemmatirosa sp.]